MFVFAKVYGLLCPDGANKEFIINNLDGSWNGIGSAVDQMIKWSAPFMLTCVQQLQQSHDGYLLQFTDYQLFFGGFIVMVWGGSLVLYGWRYSGKILGYPFVVVWRHLCCCFHTCCCAPRPEPRSLSVVVKREAQRVAFLTFGRMVFIGSCLGTLVYVSGWNDRLAYLESNIGTSPGSASNEVSRKYEIRQLAMRAFSTLRLPRCWLTIQWPGGIALGF
jgi:hypothetical protein